MEEAEKVRKENTEVGDGLAKGLHGYKFSVSNNTKKKKKKRENYALLLQVFQTNYI